MRKHIKVKAELSEDYKTVTVTFLESSHFGREFGNKYLMDSFHFAGTTSYSYFDASNKVCLVGMIGDRTAEKGHVDVDNLHMWISSPDNIGNSVTMPTEFWPKYKEAIEEYNLTEF